MTLTIERLREVCDYDAATGEFSWRVDKRRRQRKSRASGSRRRYRDVGIDGKHYYLHRLAWFYVHGEWPRLEIDHINGDCADNRISNLRLATRAENSRNQGLRKNSTSGLKGVCWDPLRQRWQSHIRIGGRKVNLGRFHTKEAAHAAYVAAIQKHHGDFARAA